MSISAPSGVSACCSNRNTGVLEGMTYIAGLRRRLVRLSWVGIGVVMRRNGRRGARITKTKKFDTMISYFRNTEIVFLEAASPQKCRVTRRSDAFVCCSPRGRTSAFCGARSF
jgi:hypothetical protein